MGTWRDVVDRAKLESYLVTKFAANLASSFRRVDAYLTSQPTSMEEEPPPTTESTKEGSVPVNWHGAYLEYTQDIALQHHGEDPTATSGLLAMDYIILNHGQVTWMTPELAPPLLTTTPHQRKDVSALDRFNVHRCPTRSWIAFWGKFCRVYEDKNLREHKFLYLLSSLKPKIKACGIVESNPPSKRNSLKELTREEIQRARLIVIGIVRIEQISELKEKVKWHFNSPAALWYGDWWERLNWPLGRVIELYPGKGGIERVAKLRVANGFVIRPLQRLYPLEMSVSDLPSDIALGENFPELNNDSNTLKFPKVPNSSPPVPNLGAEVSRQMKQTHCN
ncbi:uncharacterized protein TNCV_4998871 [Trichonephila clavipes]|nr:uncharacterized protein TNCV_4998871 [Trichonephila clavipes]